MKTIYAKILALLLVTTLASAYSDRLFQITVKMNQDGTGQVVEKTIFDLENQAEKTAFKYVLELGKTTLSDWGKFSKNVRYHLRGSTYNTRIVAAREPSISADTASITIEYTAANATLQQKIGSRTTKYQLNTDILVLSQSRSGEIILGNDMELILEVPQEAAKVKISPDAGIIREGNAVKWSGPTAGKWDVSFELEKPLSQEVNEFLVDAYNNLKSPYLLGILLAFALVIAFLKIRESASK